MFIRPTECVRGAVCGLQASNQVVDALRYTAIIEPDRYVVDGQVRAAAARVEGSSVEHSVSFPCQRIAMGILRW